MTTEFRIDRPGVYRRRDGVEVCLWSSGSNAPWLWVQIAGSESAGAYQVNGRFWWEGESSVDIVAYVGPLPADILQRMADALDAAEYRPQQTTLATFGEALQAMAEGHHE